ncbi:MAG TPA: hypothetical protein GX528_06795 [Firmicutes bacterium]|nr:hypothetical protein [Bacillota bacterium]
MRVLIMHQADKKIEGSAAALQKALEKEGLRVDLVSSGDLGSAPVSTAPYRLICVISGFKGWFRPKIPSEMKNMLERASRLAGKRAGAFVQAKLGSGKALRALMADMERQGVFVEDFGTLGGGEEMAVIAERLKRLV